MAVDMSLRREESDPSDSRVADWLDDKLQTLADLETLDALLHDVREQHVLLRQQLDEANQNLDDANKASQDKITAVRERATRFNHRQDEMDRRLRAITQEDSTDDAVSHFELAMSRLRKLDIADEYIRQLQQVDTLRNRCLDHLGYSDADALRAYHQLHQLSSSLPALQDAAEGAAPHLVDHITATTKELQARLQDEFSKQFEKVLKQVKWPLPGFSLTPELQEPFGDCIRNLLELQKLDLEASVVQSGSLYTTREPPPLVLLPLQVMVKPLELAFRYHFDTDKPTNRLEKPEFFLDHIMNKLLDQYTGFMVQHVQPIISSTFRTSDVSLNMAYADAESAFITALLPMVRRKILASLPMVVQNPQLLSHWVGQIMSFDVVLRDEWGYDDGSDADEWRGLAYDVLSTDDWFDQWLKGEKSYAMARYESIVEAEDASDLDFEGQPFGNTKSTNASVRIIDLIQSTTNTYRTLTSFSQKLRFVIDIQLAIFDRYRERLFHNFNAFQARTTRIGRTSKEEQLALQGIQGLESLCKIYGSTEHVENTLRDWSDDLFFLEMWVELDRRAKDKDRNGRITQNLTVTEVAERTSSALVTADSEEMSGAIFDETAGHYERLRSRIEESILELVSNQAREAIKPYGRIDSWSQLSESQRQPLPSSAELDPLLITLNQELGFLYKALGKVPFRKVISAVSSAIDNFLFDRVLLMHSFSSPGAAQFAADVAAIRHAFSKFVEDFTLEAVLWRVNDGARLVGLPIRGDQSTVREENEEDADAIGGVIEAEGEEVRALGLWEVEKKLMDPDLDVARNCLDRLGMDAISLSEARRVLRKRVELGA